MDPVSPPPLLSNLCLVWMQTFDSILCFASVVFLFVMQIQLGCSYPAMVAEWPEALSQIQVERIP